MLEQGCLTWEGSGKGQGLVTVALAEYAGTGLPHLGRVREGSGSCDCGVCWNRVASLGKGQGRVRVL